MILSKADQNIIKLYEQGLFFLNDMGVICSKVTGEPTGSKSSNTYKRVWARLDCGHRAMVRMHRMVFMMVHGRLPMKGHMIDHIDGDILNNHPNNLRECTPKGNNWNSKVSTVNSTGFKCVSVSRSKYRFETTIGGLKVHGVSRSTAAEAARDRDNWVRDHAPADYRDNFNRRVGIDYR